MKKFLPVLALLFASPAMAWNCPTGQIRQQAPPGTPTTTPFYDVVEGIAFICVPATPANPTPGPAQQQNQSQNSSANSTSTANSNSSSTSNAAGGNSAATAAGGSATATGGSSAVKNSGNSTVNNSGNSSNTNTNSATGGAGGSASSSNNSSGNSTSFTENVQRNTPMAYAPEAAFTTSPCVKGFSGGASSPGFAGSFGVSKTDKGCDSRQTAVIFHALGNDEASARILCSTDAAKRAKLTLAQCLMIVTPKQVLVEQPPQPQPQAVTPRVITWEEPKTEVKPQPVPERVETPVRLTDLGSFRVLRTTAAGVCPTTRVALSPQGIAILDRAIGMGRGEIILTGNVYTSGVAVSYLRKRATSKISVTAADDQEGTVSVQFFGEGK